MSAPDYLQDEADETPRCRSCGETLGEGPFHWRDRAKDTHRACFEADYGDYLRDCRKDGDR